MINGEPVPSVGSTISTPSQKIKVVDESGCENELTMEGVGSAFGFEYCCYIQFLHESLLRNMQFWSLDNAASIPIASENGYDKKIDDGFIINKVSLRYIGEIDGIDTGYGLFAECAIEVGEMIGEYTGVVLENSSTSSSSFSLNYPSADRELVVNAREIGNIIRFVNHSPNPNTKFKPFLHDGLVHVICVSNYRKLLRFTNANVSNRCALVVFCAVIRSQ